MTAARPRLAVYWTTGCGGCEAAFLDLGTRLLDLEREADLVFFPLLRDTKLAALRALPDRSLDAALVTGAVRTPEDAEMVATLRRVSNCLVALGACSISGSVLGLANLVPAETLLRDVYGDAGHTSHPGPPPGPRAGAAPPPAGILDRLRTLEEVTTVDYSVPGCPPEAERLWDAVRQLLGGLGGGAPMPERGSVLGARDGTVCEECDRPRPALRARRFLRIHEAVPEPSRCLLDQGLVCSGPATRAGCGALCPAAGLGCRGCYGAPEGILDEGARMLAALTSLAGVEKGETEPAAEDPLRRRVDEEVESLVDPVGTLYRYGFPVSFLARLGRGAGGPVS